jgi:hypothetical protein
MQRRFSLHLARHDPDRIARCLINPQGIGVVVFRALRTDLAAAPA